MASLTRWTRVWVNSGSWWWTGRPGVLRFMGSQRVGHDWATELNWIWLRWASLGKVIIGVRSSVAERGGLGKCREGKEWPQLIRGSLAWQKEHATRSKTTGFAGSSSITCYHVIVASLFLFPSILICKIVIIILALPPSQGCYKLK